jgi:dihydroorotase
MAEVGLLLLIHGEVTDPAVDIFDREKVFISTILQPILTKFPTLKVVMEHITTADAVQYVLSQPSSSNLAATITPHHLLYNRNDIFRGGICPHMYCLPILKREDHRKALLNAAISGNPRFFIGTDSAPHAIESKETSCGCAGIFTAHAAIELYVEAFESMNALEKLEGFMCRFGQEFYGFPPSQKKIKVVKESWIVPERYKFGKSVVKPLRAGETINWKLQHT